MIAASWTIEQATYAETGPYAGVLLHADVIMAVLVLPPILALRARSILSQIVALLFPVAAYYYYETSRYYETSATVGGLLIFGVKPELA